MEKTQNSGEARGADQDVWSLLFLIQVACRRWKIFVFIPLVFAGIIGGFSTLVTPKFEYKTVLELGHYKNEEGIDTFIESAKSVSEQLRLNLRIAVQKHEEGHNQPANINTDDNFNLLYDTNGGVLELLLIAPDGIAGELLDLTIRQVEAEHNDAELVVRQEYLEQINIAQAVIEKVDLQSAILNKRLNQLSYERSILEKQREQLSKKLESYINGAGRQMGLGNSKNALETMLLGNVIGQIQENLSTIQLRMLSSIPEKSSKIKIELVNNELVKTEKQEDIKKQQLRLKAFKSTKKAFGPERSKKPVSPRPLILGAIGFVLGGGGAFILVLIQEAVAWRRTDFEKNSAGEN